MDARRVSSGETLVSDLCIVGGGAAGISIALQMANTGVSVVLLESGDFYPKTSTQTLAQGSSVGLPYFSLDACRPRCLGGTTSLWGGWCRPLDAVDFERHDWVAHSGWPFSRDHLDSAYRGAQKICGLDPLDFDQKTWQSDNIQGLFAKNSGAFEDAGFQIAATRFGETYRAQLQKTRDLRVFLNANVLDLQTNEQGSIVTGGRVATLAGNLFSARAKCFAIAAGGIENARLLLLSRNLRGLGNHHDIAGRYFADHLHVSLGTVEGCESMSFYANHKVGGVALKGAVSLSARLRRSNQLLGFAVTFHNIDDPHDVLRPTEHAGYKSLLNLIRTPIQHQRPTEFIKHSRNIVMDLGDTLEMIQTRVRKPKRRQLMVGCRAEQTPNPESRVTLDLQKDRFGMPRARLDWRVTKQDSDSLHSAQLLLQSELSRRSVRMNLPPRSEEAETNCGVQAGAHHMGTTRMHDNPKLGVVDASCRVHGVKNLYIAGGSVFPTTGWAPPTLTVVALSIRVAASIRELLTQDTTI